MREASLLSINLVVNSFLRHTQTIEDRISDTILLATSEHAQNLGMASTVLTACRQHRPSIPLIIFGWACKRSSQSRLYSSWEVMDIKRKRNRRAQDQFESGRWVMLDSRHWWSEGKSVSKAVGESSLATNKNAVNESRNIKKSEQDLMIQSINIFRPAIAKY